MNIFKVGDKVIFTGKEHNSLYLKNDTIYTVKKSYGHGTIELEEISREHSYNQIRFRFANEEMLEQTSDTSMFKHITDEMYETYKKKNADYGNSFSEQFKEYGALSSCIRLEDKLRRLKRLTKNESMVKDESIEDTLLDMANYAILTVIELRKEK